MKRQVLLLAAALALSAAGRAEYVWLEAETPARGNFPPPEQNPFAPAAFWEEDLLSGGKWTGLYWKKEERPELFLEFDFETRQPGDFALYSRKFFTYGNFRWRVDDGPWQTVPQTLHEPLESVPMRDTAAEKFTLSWHYMGAVPIQPGRHTLRVEPLDPAPLPRRPDRPELPGYPLAYDVFILTNAPFFPAGKLRPGQRFEPRQGGAFAFQPPPDPFEPCPIDWRALNEPNAGDKGGVTLKDGRFVFRSTGEEVRLVGVNLGHEQNAADNTVRYLARALAKKGVNLARLDIGPVFTGGMDPVGGPQLETEAGALAQLLRLIEALRREGIYTALTWNLANVRKASLFGGFGEEGAYDAVGDFSPHQIFDPRYQELVRKGWLQVLAAPTPSGAPLASSPALALITLGQQVSLFAEPEPGQPETPAPVSRLAQAAFEAWLLEKYKSPAAARKAWEADGAALQADGLPLPSVAEMARNPGLRARDAARFRAEAQRRWMESLAADIRAAGYQGLLSFANRPPSRPDLLGAAAAWANSGSDLSERVGVYSAPYEAADNPWVITAGSRFQNRSALRLDPLPGLGEESRFALPVKALLFNGKPAALTEIGWTAPNEYRSEMPLLAFTLAALQDVRLAGFLTLSGFNWHQALPNSRLPLFTPAGLGQFPALAYAYRRGLLPGPVRAAVWTIPEKELFTLEPAPLTDIAAAPVTGAPAAVVLPEDAPHPALSFAGYIEVRTGKGPAALVVEKPVEEGIGDGRLTLGGGAVRWDYDRGLFIVDAPSFQAAGGFLKTAGRVETAQMTLTSPSEFATVCLVPLDGKPLDFSSRMLLQIFTRERNAGEFIEGAETRVIRSLGRPPVVIEPAGGVFSLNRPDARDILVTALDANGYPVLPAGDASALHLLPATYYYLLEK